MERRRFEVNAWGGVDRKVGAEKENVVVVAWRAIVGEIRKMRFGDAFLFFFFLRGIWEGAEEPKAMIDVLNLEPRVNGFLSVS